MAPPLPPYLGGDVDPLPLSPLTPHLGWGIDPGLVLRAAVQALKGARTRELEVAGRFLLHRLVDAGRITPRHMVWYKFEQYMWERCRCKLSSGRRGSCAPLPFLPPPSPPAALLT